MKPSVAVIVGAVAAGAALAPLAGCATLSPQEQDQLRAQVGSLQSRVAALNSQVEELRTRQQSLEERAWEHGARPAPTVASAAEAVSDVPASHRVLTGKEIQLALQHAGVYHGPMDGKLGPQTRVAIKVFQSAHHLKADGVAGTRTMIALQAYLAAPESKEPAAAP